MSALSVTAGVRPFPLAMQHFYSFVSQVISLLLSPRFGACTAGVRPFLLGMQHFYAFVPYVILYFCLHDFCTYVSQVRCLHCWGPPFSAGHAAFLFICLPCDFLTFSPKQVAVRGSQCFLRVSALLRDSVSDFRPACHPLSPFLLVTVSALSPFCLPSCCAVPTSALQSCPFVSQHWTAVLQSFTCAPALDCGVHLCLAILYMCLSALDCCVRLCLAILCLPALDVANSSCRVFRF